jgi:GNAT superfamily N-acetyltransferase
MPLTIRPLTPELWPQLEDLFGPTRGACNGCWCMYWRIGGAYSRRPREENKRDFRRIVDEGPPPGLLAFSGDLAVGWCQLTPRGDIPYIESKRLYLAVDQAPVWSISCFYVRRGWRKKGVTTALIEAAADAARVGGAPALEAYPIDPQKPMGAGNLYTGLASSFRRAGFHEVARRAPARPIVRLDLTLAVIPDGAAQRRRSGTAKGAGACRGPG